MEDSGVSAERQASLLIVGLGNPGNEYVFTRHNVGFWVVDTLMHNAERVEKAEWQPSEGELYRLCRSDNRQEDVLILKPLTYMNLSGLAVAPTMEWAGLTPASLLVVSDDLDMQLGRLRLRVKGSSGGHRGLGSITEVLGTQEFARLRIGIGRPQPGDAGVKDYVLGSWASEEQALFNRVVDEAVSRLNKYIAGEHDGFSAMVEADSSDKVNAEKTGDPEIEKVRSSCDSRPAEG